MPLSKNKFWCSNNSLHFSKCAVPFTFWHILSPGASGSTLTRTLDKH